MTGSPAPSSAPPSATRSAGRSRAGPRADRRAPRRPDHRHRGPVGRRRLAHRPPHRPVPQGRRPRHRRHLDDPCAGKGVRHRAGPSRRVLRRRPSRTGADLDPRWIPELEAEALPLQRIFLAEKWIVARLHYGHVDPREAGSGNIVNCGAAMYMAPVGLVNAAHPQAAYAEALDVAGAHQSSYGRRPPESSRRPSPPPARRTRRPQPSSTPVCRSPRTGPGPPSKRSVKWPCGTGTSRRH